MTASPAQIEATTTIEVARTGGLVAAIANVMAEVDIVAKRGVNEFHRYRYARMEDILREITPLLGKHGLVIFQSETGRAMFDEDNVIAVEYAFTVAHVSGETWPPVRQTGVSACRNTKGGWDDKSLNKCHTAARKYFLLALFQIPTGEEDDADQGTSDNQKQSVAKPAVNRPRISDRAIAARTERTWQGQRTQPFSASEAGNRDLGNTQLWNEQDRQSNFGPAPDNTDPEISARRASVQLQRSFEKPAYVVEPPQRKLQRQLNKERNCGPNWEAKIRAEQRDRRTGKFQQPIPNRGNPPIYDERNPPPGYDSAPPKDDIPEFLDRRKASGCPEAR
jgi:hypothetical protein